MEPAAVLPILMGFMAALVGGYLLLFRPFDRRPALLGGALLALGTFFLLGGGVDRQPAVVAFMALAFYVLVLLFLASFPVRFRWRSLSGVAFAVAGLGMLAPTVYVLVGTLHGYGPVTQTWEYAVTPTGLTPAALVGVVALARYRDLPDRLDDEGHAARVFYLVAVPVTLVGAGWVGCQALVGLIGGRPLPLWLRPDADLGFVALGVLGWWLVPIALAAYAWTRWRWTLPAYLMLAGALSYLPLLVRPDLDPFAVVMLRGWGILIIPALALYAQARWSPFRGEPAGVGPTTALPVAGAAIAYSFVALAVLIVSPDATVAYFVGPILGVAAAIGVAALVLPRARLFALRRLLAGGGFAGGGPIGPGSVVLGRYRVTRLLAEGGQGRIFEAEDRRRGSRVVLKAVATGSADGEADALRALVHPNVVRLIEIAEVPGLALLVLEFVEGGDLRGLLARRDGSLRLDEALATSRGVLQGLAAAHALGIAHRDVKPENVLLDADGTPKLADFGAARRTSEGATARTGDLGTLAYMAPEQIRGEPGDARADVYAAGVLIHEVLTGRRPVQTRGRDDFTIRQAILTEPVRIHLPAAARGLGRVLGKALEKQPEARYDDASAMLEAFTANLERITLEIDPAATG